MKFNAQRALVLLRLGSGQADASFREGQEDAICHIVEGRGRLLVVQKTGWGKSFVYFIATKLLREEANGPALLISPLLALMRNQIAAAERMGVRAKWQLTAANLSEAFWERADRLTALRRDEQRQMQEYVSLRSGHMEFLIQALDGDPSTDHAPALPSLPTTTDPTLVREAVAYLRRTSLPIEPRRQWPAGGMPQYRLTGRIAVELQAQPGEALCVWGDAGWGSLVRQGKYHDGHFADELVEACAVLVREWNPQPTPTWVTCIPSLRHPDLVPDFARRLAAALRLPFDAVLEKTDNRPEQKTMANSTQQARNIDGSLAINAQGLRAGPVLLVDDMVDSRWTLTVAAWLLRSHGSGEVLPLALALAGHDE